MAVDLDAYRLARSARMDRHFLDNLTDAGECGLTRLVSRSSQPHLERLDLESVRIGGVRVKLDGIGADGGSLALDLVALGL
ncbi:hypothetical protein [Bradyrhizobium japonicum]|uniref:hypothetical protein n=1 Tax=Bradyrhizobium japonicum TaxID=375 RepID=UPI0021688604|nr:hypothetical protein [Bradyrhizobium japonicum]